MALAQYSLSNLNNSVATYLTSQLLADGYLIYWRPLDALQTSAGLYRDWSTLQDSILLNPAVAAAYASSRGIISILDPDVAIPAVAARPTVDGTSQGPEQTPVPSMTIRVRHNLNGELMELGSRRRERWAVLSILGYGRDHLESIYLVDKLRLWFDALTDIPLRDHDSGTQALVQQLEVHDPAVSSSIVPLAHEAQKYEIALSASLRYEA